MREIKFEIIYEDLNEKIQKQIVTLDNLILGVWELPTDRLRIIARREYIGLKDKNDIDIYEGDIVKNDQNNKLYEVVFYYHGFYFRRIDKKGVSHISNISQSPYEKVGTIYENKELLQIKPISTEV